MALWSGLGYYARARNLHRLRASRRCTSTAAGFRATAEVIAQLPGIGRSTANSIAAFCFGARAPILDGNVKRVLCRAFGIEGFPGSGAVEKRLWALADELMPSACTADLQPGADGSRRHGVHPRQAALRGLPAHMSLRRPARPAAAANCRRPNPAHGFRYATSRCWCCGTVIASCSKRGRRPASGADCCRCRNCRTAPMRGNGPGNASPAALAPLPAREAASQVRKASQRQRGASLWELLTTPSATSACTSRRCCCR